MLARNLEIPPHVASLALPCSTATEWTHPLTKHHKPFFIGHSGIGKTIPSILLEGKKQIHSFNSEVQQNQLPLK